MIKNSIVPQIYGYAVCLVSIVTFMFALPLGIRGLADYANPARANGAPKICSTPFLEWKQDFLMRISNTFVDGEEGQHKATDALVLPVPNDSTLISLYENEKQLAIESFKHHLFTPVLQQGFLSAISLVLFLIHWRWLRRSPSIQP